MLCQSEHNSHSVENPEREELMSSRIRQDGLPDVLSFVYFGERPSAKPLALKRLG